MVCGCKVVRNNTAHVHGDNAWYVGAWYHVLRNNNVIVRGMWVHGIIYYEITLQVCMVMSLTARRCLHGMWVQCAIIRGGVLPQHK